MKNKIIAICLALIICLGLCGCQLALPDGEEAGRDRLIGCFITTEHLDLFDFEAYLNENANKLLKGDSMISERDSQKYSGRIYAELYEEAYTDSEGVEHTTYNYRFPELEGIAFFAPTVFERDGQEYITTQSGEGLNDVKNHIMSHNDDTYYTELSATIYAAVDAENELIGTEACFYTNPVYQAADGSVYLLSGNGMAMNAVSAGVVMSTKLSEEYKTTINGEEKIGGGSVEISFATAYVPHLLRVIEMDADGNTVKRRELAASELPESYQPDTATAYIIAEMVADTAGGEEYVERSFIEPEGENVDIYVFAESENGYLVKNYCQVLWAE